MVKQLRDYEGKISNITVRTHAVYISTDDGMVHDMTAEDYVKAVDFAGFNPRKRSTIRGFRVVNENGEDIEYKYYFVR